MIMKVYVFNLKRLKDLGIKYINLKGVYLL